MNIKALLEKHKTVVLSEMYNGIRSNVFTEPTPIVEDDNGGADKNNTKKKQHSEVMNRVSNIRKDIEDLKIKMRSSTNDSYKELVNRTIETKRKQIKDLERQIGKAD